MPEPGSAAAGAAASGDDSTAYHYPPGEALTAEEALELTRAVPVCVVVLAGPANSGKTTLLASLYEQFHYGPVGGFLFAGSRTLVGFERRCHLSRRASGRDTPDTERTSQTAEDLLLHLSLRPGRAGLRREVLFADVYGEAFRLAADSTEECEQLTVLGRADHVGLLIDGEKLASTTHRQEPYSQADALLASCIEVGLLGRHSRVQIVVTKWDILSTGPLAETQMTFAREKSTLLQRRHADRLGGITHFEVAARPEVSSGVEQPLGLEELLRAWAAAPTPARVQEPVVTPPPDPGRAFDWFSRAWPAGGR